MDTELAKNAKPVERSNDAPDHIVLAVGVIIERIKGIPEADRADLYELVKGLLEAKNRDDVESIRSAMIEILDQEPIVAEPLAAAGTSEKFNKWKAYIGARIKELRTQAKMTQDELAEASGLPQSHISRLEKGEHCPSHLTLEKLAKALHRPMGDFDPSA